MQPFVNAVLQSDTKVAKKGVGNEFSSCFSKLFKKFPTLTKNALQTVLLEKRRVELSLFGDN